MAASPYAEQFPWDKVDAAKRYLYLVKPWWARFGQKMKIVPVYQRPPEGSPYGSITSTDGGFRLYIDVGFASWAPLHLLAGALEHEFQHHTRNTWGRLGWLSLDDWRKWANVVLDLEINSGIDHESRQLSMEKIRALAEKSQVFVDYELDFWSVAEPPNVGELGWLPRLMGLPDRLSAEEYLNILQMAMKEPPPPPEGGESGDDGNEGEGNGQSDPEDDGASSSDESGESGSRADPAEEGRKDNPSGEEDRDSPREDEAPARENDRQADADAPGSDGEQDPSSDIDDGSEKGDENGQDSGSQNGGDDASGGDEEQSGDGDQPDGGGSGAGDADDGGSGAESGEGDSVSESAGQGGKPSKDEELSAALREVAEKFNELKKTGDRRMWSAEIANPKDDLLKPAWKPEERRNEKPLDRASIEGALIELEEDVRQYGNETGDAPFGLGPGADLLQWVAKRRKVRGVDWQSRLNKLVSSSYTSAKVHGASDLSYTVRNPNQPEFGVILQGLHDYAPTVVVIQDVSGSMLINNRMNKSMSAFTDLCGKILGRFNSPVTWVTVDAGIVDVGKASSWSKHQQKRWSYGFGGTEIAPAINDVMTGKLVWDGRKYPKADLTIISTDCAFEWPRQRPVRNGKLLVVSVDSDREKLEKFLPKWIDRKRELVVIED